jgi:aminopeptidase N
VRRPDRRRAAAAVATLALLAGLTACSDTGSSGSGRGPSDAGSATTAVDDPEDLTPAVSDPVEDSVYPAVGDPSVDALHYDLDLTWDPDSRILAGDETLTFRSTGDGDHVQLDLAAPLEVASIRVDGKKAAFRHKAKNLVVTGRFAKDRQYVLRIAYRGAPHPVPAPTTRRDFSTTGFTVTSDGAAWTMQEPYGAYSWYAVNDQPSDKAFYDFTLTVPSPWTGVANGVMTSRKVVDGSTVTDWHLDSRTSSYLVTVAFGDYKMSKDTSSQGTPLTYWVPRSWAPYTDRVEYAAEALDWVEGKLGPYPFSSLGVLLVDSRSGMETQTMITLGATSYTTARETIVHEIVHQWYGDEVTPSDWRDLWMNEGMAMYLQFVWEAETTDTPIEDLLRAAVPYERASRRVNGPPADYDPRTFGEIQVYYGPALMWDEIRRRVGDEKFWAMVRDWPNHDKDGTVDRDEYLPWIEKQTGTELSDLFNGWLFAKESPEFS